MLKRKKLILFALLSVVAVTVFLVIRGINKKVVSTPARPPFETSQSTFNKNCVNQQKIQYASYQETDALWKNNNKFGLYIYAEEPELFETAQKLVNSNGGDWGYVLIPFNVKDGDYGKWKRVFEQLRNKKLIPIIQLWDVDTDDYKEQTAEAAEFLNSFIWPIKYRYVSVYNEPNDANFWYGKVDPKEYAKILNYTIDTFKKENENFFMLNGAFNASAATSLMHMDEFMYLSQMETAVPGIFNKLDGWASHPYPQPNFSGSVNDRGSWSIRAYEDELEYLKNELNITKELPVFITETGWAHAEGANFNFTFLSVKKVAENLKTAYSDVWLKDDRVRAVTPFTVKYDPPFDHFSWINKDGVPYYHYEVIKEMKKIKGEPPYLKVDTAEVDSCE